MIELNSNNSSERLKKTPAENNNNATTLPRLEQTSAVKKGKKGVAKPKNNTKSNTAKVNGLIKKKRGRPAKNPKTANLASEPLKSYEEKELASEASNSDFEIVEIYQFSSDQVKSKVDSLEKSPKTGELAKNTFETDHISSSTNESPQISQVKKKRGRKAKNPKIEHLVEKPLKTCTPGPEKKKKRGRPPKKPKIDQIPQSTHESLQASNSDAKLPPNHHNVGPEDPYEIDEIPNLAIESPASSQNASLAPYVIQSDSEFIEMPIKYPELCQRTSCSNLSQDHNWIKRDGREMYCSVDCLVIHCRKLFTDYLQARNNHWALKV